MTEDVQAKPRCKDVETEFGEAYLKMSKFKLKQKNMGNTW
jgi:hypothetical protein